MNKNKKNEILEKIEDLIKFITSDMFETLKFEEKSLISYNILIYYDIKNDYMNIGRNLERIFKSFINIQKNVKKLNNINYLDKNKDKLRYQLIKDFVKNFTKFCNVNNSLIVYQQLRNLRKLKFENEEKYKEELQQFANIDAVVDVVDNLLYVSQEERLLVEKLNKLVDILK